VYVYYAAPTPTYSLNGTWDIGSGFIVYISGSTGTITQIGSAALHQSAASKGYIKVGDQEFKNLSQTGDRTWSGQVLNYQAYANAPNVCIGTIWRDVTITMSTDAQTFQCVAPGATDPYSTWTRR
jgi:hypothetical protein